MSNKGLITLNNKTYGYDADFDETSQKWYGEVFDKSGKTIHTTEYANSYPAAIQLCATWIKKDSRSQNELPYLLA